MKHLMNFNKRKLALSLMAALAWGGVSSAWADAYTCGFETSEGWANNSNFKLGTLGEGWAISGTMTTYQLSDTYAKTGSYGIYCSTSNASDYIITPELAAGTITYQAKGKSRESSGYNVFVYECSLNDDGTTYTIGTVNLSNSTYNGDLSTSSWKEFSITLTKDTRLAFRIAKAAIDDFSAPNGLSSTIKEGPALIVKDGSKVTSPYTFDFGLATAGTTKTFTLSNPGTEAVEGLAVSANNFNATLSATTIAASGEATLTITMPETTASNTITLSSTTEGIDEFVFNVSGTIRNPNKVYLDFADGQMPEGWTSVAVGSYAASYNTYSWKVSNGYIGTSATSNIYKYAFTSPKLTFEEGEVILFESAKYNSTSNSSIEVQYSIDGENYTTIGSAITNDVYGTWTKRSVIIPTADAKFIRFSGLNVYLRNIYGGEIPNEPKMVVTQPESLDFGVITEATTKTFTIANTGKATLEGINVVSSNEAFTVTGAPTSLAAGASAIVTITMDVNNKGLQNADITVKGDGQTDVTFSISGYILDTEKFFEDFSGNALPAGWELEGSNWSFANGVAKSAYSSTASYLVTPTLVGNAGDVLFFQVKSTYNGTVNLKVDMSKDGGNYESVLSTSLTSADNGVIKNFTINIAENGNYKFRFKNEDYELDNVNGLEKNENAPVLSVTPAEDAAFGKVTATPEAKTYTVANTGTGKMTVNIASSSEDFTVSPATIENIENGAPQTFTVTFNYNVESLGDKEADITVTPTYNAEEVVSFKATATAKDPNVWEEDFEAGTFAEGWIANNWSISTPGSYSGGNGTKMAGGSSKSATLITPRLEATEGQSLSFDLGGSGSSWPLVVEYSTDRNTWNAIETFTEDGTKTINAPMAGNFYLRFTGYVYIDNITGFKLSPLEHDAIIKAQNVPATGTQYVEYTASVTVEEMAGKAEELTAQFFIGDTQYGEDVTETVEANGTKTFTVTFTTEVSVSGDAYFIVSNADINLESAKTAVEIAAATVIDENATNEFAEGRLAAVVLNYTKVAGKWGTIALPFQTTAADLATAFGVSEIKTFGYKSSAENSMTFQPATSTMYAGYVYVIYSDEALNGAKFFDVQVTAPTAKSDGESTKLQATYAPVDMEGKWGITPDGNIMQGLAGASLKAMRGYITTTEGARLSLIIEDTTSGITTVMEAGDLNEQQAVYNLQGQKMQQAGKGLYIVNGKKMVRK